MPPSSGSRPTSGSGRPKLASLAGDDDVAAEHHLEAAAEREAVDAGDDRQVQALAQGDAAEAAGARPGPSTRARWSTDSSCRRRRRRRARRRRSARPRARRCAARDRVQMRCSSASVARSIALSTSGRSIVSVATWSRTSKPHAHDATLRRALRRFGEHFVGVLAEARRHAAQGHRRARHRDRAGDEAVARAAGGRPFHHHRVVHGLRIDQHLAHVAHRRAQQVLRFEPRQPVVARVGRGSARGTCALQLGLVRELLRRGWRSAHRARDRAARARRRCRAADWP